MEIVAHEKQSPFASEPIWRLIVRFAVPSVIALLVNSLYNIVDQIFIGNGVGYMGNGATNIVFPITIIALALAMMIGNGGAAFLSLKLGGGNVDSAKQGIGNAVTMSVVVSIILTAVFLIFINPILTLFGATDTLRPYALEILLVASEIISVLAFLLFQLAPVSVISLFGSEDGLYNEFAVKAFRIFLLLCPLTGFQTVIAVYLQAVGKPVMSALLSLARQIIFFVPAALLLPLALGVEGVLWTGPVADGLAFVMSLVLLLYERNRLKKSHAARTAAQAQLLS